MSMKIALAGNPNCGKTTMFNNLTGANQYVGNWPGVTVEKKEGRLKGYSDVIVTDLPGIYSLSPYTLEEVVSRNYIINEHPDVILNLVDGSNIERNLYLTTQLLEMGVPVVIALNMIDIVRKNGDKIDTEVLGMKLGCPVVETSALSGLGLKEAAAKAVEMAKDKNVECQPLHFNADVEKALEEIKYIMGSSLPETGARWTLVKLFERDREVWAKYNLPDVIQKQLEKIIAGVEEKLDDDCESIITNARYDYITGLMADCVKKVKVGMTTSDKIDQIVTNRILALPIFAAVMFFVYYIAVTTIGTDVTDWTNDVLFGEMIMPSVQEAMENAGAAEWYRWWLTALSAALVHRLALCRRWQLCSSCWRCLKTAVIWRVSRLLWTVFSINSACPARASFRSLFPPAAACPVFWQPALSKLKPTAV